jgi:hypothetical protein
MPCTGPFGETYSGRRFRFEGRPPYLLHISESLERIEEYVGGGREAFLADRKTQDAVLRNLQTMAESRRLRGGGSERPRGIGDAPPSP